MMKCSSCASVNVCRFVGDMKQTEDQVKEIKTNELPFSVAITCEFFNEDKRIRESSLLSKRIPSYNREDIPRV